MRSGLFITFEGGEGAGKTTQVEFAASRLKERGVDAYVVREPGGTTLGDEIRRLLLDPENQHPSPRAELLLYEASRAQLVEAEIAPRLEAGETVLCDRFTDSTLAYQLHARGLDEHIVRGLNSWSAFDLTPDLTIVLDVDVGLALGRATQGGADRLESEHGDFHRRVREGFLAIAHEEPDRVKVVAAEGAPELVADRVWEHIAAVLEERDPGSRDPDSRGSGG